MKNIKIERSVIANNIVPLKFITREINLNKNITKKKINIHFRYAILFFSFQFF